MNTFRDLLSEGRIAWAAEVRGWIGHPGDIVDALAREGFAEFKADAARGRRGGPPSGGIWQGLDARTGAVASAVWVRPPGGGHAVVYVDVDGTPINEHEAGG
jgi:hypothetical protein